jgi:hypothetical protein
MAAVKKKKRGNPNLKKGVRPLHDGAVPELASQRSCQGDRFPLAILRRQACFRASIGIRL